jgi:hypothetical protein
MLEKDGVRTRKGNDLTILRRNRIILIRYWVAE